MAGRAEYNQEDTPPLSQVFLLDDKDEWELARNPLNRHSTIRKDLNMQRLGPGYHFAKDMTTARPERSIGLIVNARGGSGISEWEPGTHYYEEAVRRSLIATRSGSLRGIVWHQGETDAEDPEYLARLVAFARALRADLGDEQLPFVAGQINQVPLINEQIARLPLSLKVSGFASSDGLVAVDEWHFDAPSVQLLGERYAVEMLKLTQP